MTWQEFKAAVAPSDVKDALAKAGYKPGTGGTTWQNANGEAVNAYSNGDWQHFNGKLDMNPTTGSSLTSLQDHLGQTKPVDINAYPYAIGSIIKKYPSSARRTTPRLTRTSMPGACKTAIS